MLSKVLLVGRDPRAVRSLEALLIAQSRFAVTVRILSNGHTDPLHDIAETPDVLLLACDDGHLLELEHLAGLAAAARPPLVICGALRSAAGARFAVRCGAADLLPAVPSREELVEALGRAAIQQSARQAPHAARAGAVVTVIGAAGGVGASFIAMNLAHLALQQEGRTAVLVDLDLQYAPLTGYLGIKPESGLSDALTRVDSLDATALSGYVARHPSGLGLMAEVSSAIGASRPDAADFRRLLGLLAGQHDRVVLDASRSLDPFSTIAVMDSQRVVLVLEQSVGNVQNAARLYNALTRELGVSRDSIQVLLNRYSRRAAITAADVERTLGCLDVIEVGSAYELARDSLDAGMPLADKDRRSTLARALSELSAQLDGNTAAEETGFLRRALPLFRKEIK